MSKHFLRFILGCLVLVLVTSGVVGQEYSLDDDPAFPLTSPPSPPYRSAEDPFNCGLPGLPSVPAGLVGPSPSLSVGPFYDSDILVPGPTVFPKMSFPLGGVFYVASISADHSSMYQDPDIKLRFSIDRATGGLPGSAAWIETMMNQQPGDIFDSTKYFTNPSVFVGTLPPGPPVFTGLLPTAGSGGSNVLYLDESALKLTAGNGPGTLVGSGASGVMCPPITPKSHDNVDAYNDFPGPLYKNYIYFSLYPADAVPMGFSAADIFAAKPGTPGFYPPPFATANMIGLDISFGPNTDCIDALVVFDNGKKLVCEPGIDYALFSLSPCSLTLATVNWILIPAGFQFADPGAIFFTDFTGVFALYAYSTDIGVTLAPSMTLPGVINVDALEVHQ
jgi:hypothetical protein